MVRILVLLIYNLLYPLILLVMTPAALRKMKARGGKASDLRPRLGIYDEHQRSAFQALHRQGEVIWMHAVSVGEVGIATKLVRELLHTRPSLRVVLSTTTPTGFAQAEKFAQDMRGVVLPIYNPLDGWFTVRRCLRTIKPQQLVLVEAEIWPNLVFAATRQGIPVTLVNARLSPRSERRYRKVAWLIKPIFSLLNRVFVQEPEDVGRWQNLGLEADRIVCTGSIKFDMAGDMEPLDQVAQLRDLLTGMGCGQNRPVLLAASTHAGEEIALAKVFLQLRTAVPDLFFIVVPRHVERTMEIETALRDLGLKVARRSAGHGDTVAPDVLLVDTTGELRAWQHLATVVVVGKSFLATGGQNPAEAVMAGKPVVFGPHMENFAALVRILLGKKGAVQVAHFEELHAGLLNLFQHPEEAARLARSGREALQAHEGATQRTANGLLSKNHDKTI
jgi:3-deoxy-D-manno-octulosonic-acid transferase